MKKILITGATGFIGSNIFLHLKDNFKIYLPLRKKFRKIRINLKKKKYKNYKFQKLWWIKFKDKKN